MFKNLSIIVFLAAIISGCNDDDDGGSPVVDFPPDFVAGKIFKDRLKNGSFAPEMVMIPAGSFRMGDIQGGGDSDEQPVHDVSVEKFAMGKFEVTVGEYMKFVKATNTHVPLWLKEGGKKNYKIFGSALTNENHPIVGVSWYDATSYAKWLTNQTGKQYRLPTEAEWEYAARAGTETSRSWGNDSDLACSYANMADKTAKEKFSRWIIHNCTDGYVYTAPVGSFKKNKFGLYDTSGNVWEWTCSEYEAKYNGKEKACISKYSNKNRVLRGGSWRYIPKNLRSANRYWGPPSNGGSNGGFRVVRAAWPK